MNPIFIRLRLDISRSHPFAVRSAVCGVLLIALIFVLPGICAQNAPDLSLEFKRIAAQLSTARLDGTQESEAQQEKALTFLDSVALSALAGGDAPDLSAANQRLAALVSHTPPVGENYRLVKLGGNPAAYAMVVNFGLGGPAAVRIYARVSGHYGFAARIDRFTNKDFFDSDLELIPASSEELVFVTIAGRTDDLSTGIFMAWRWDGVRLGLLWTSDLLQQSSYQSVADGFHLTYCAEPDDDHPEKCLKMTRDVYRVQSGEWKRIESSDLGPGAIPAK
jgi:hypothetical protein